jgi:hypothetical protein
MFSYIKRKIKEYEEKKERIEQQIEIANSWPVYGAEVELNTNCFYAGQKGQIVGINKKAGFEYRGISMVSDLVPVESELKVKLSEGNIVYVTISAIKGQENSYPDLNNH